MSSFICPVCGKDLTTNEKSLSCPDGHAFDRARCGYANLLLSQQIKARRHGDDKLMVRSRQAFLDKGYYNPLLENILATVGKYAQNGHRIIDAGCGECWYTANIYADLAKNQIRPEMMAVDISKDALCAGARRNREIELAVASIFNLPVKDNSCDLLLNFFAPCCGEEFHRVLKTGGCMIRVIPLEKHLWRLKTAVYEHPYENEVGNCFLDGFELLEKLEIRRMIHLAGNEDILHVFTMTPYYYKTCIEDQQKLRCLSELDTEIEFGILVYRKTSPERAWASRP